MDRNKRTSITVGILLILFGIFFALLQVVPAFKELVNMESSWVFIFGGVALLLLILGAIFGVPDMAIPAAIVAGIGGILFYQVNSGNWGSWSYLWTLFPGFAGIGMLLANVMGARDKYPLRSSLDTLVTSLVLLAIFGSFFGAFKVLGPYWPLLLVAAGILIGIRTLVKKERP